MLGCLFLAALLIPAVIGGAIGAAIGHGPANFGWILGVGLFLVVVLFLLGAISSVMRRVTTPVSHLIDAASRIEAGDYSARVAESGPRDLRSVARAFNSMSTRLKTIDEQRRGNLADVTHELRTPLSVIKGQAEAIADGVYPADAEHIAPILDATEALDRLVEDLRTLALTDASNLVLKREPTNIAHLVHDSVDAFQSRAGQAGVLLTNEVAGDPPTLEVDPARIRSAIGNVLSNAIRHTPIGGTVNVVVTATGDRATITVKDTGPGIEPSLLAHVFERFVKGPDSTGSGLGLAIAHEIVTAHGGTIEIANAPAGGTLVTISLPKSLPH